ncbi:LCP family protein [Spirillospora sp. CA-294931]|uniref:LCP family protein n=1 Tax=Spirillospora sp. CA-294931 TaxID=3240042 RepID=UPI003D8BE84A
MASQTADRGTAEADPEPASDDAHGLPRALALTLASAFVWGVAHLWSGRRVAGGVLLGVFVALGIGAAVAAALYRDELIELAVQPDWLSAMVGGLVLLGLIWITVVVHSYQTVRPGALSPAGHIAGGTVVALLCFGVAVPVAWSAYNTYVARDALTSIFRSGNNNGRHIDASDPWKNQPRVNILLLGGDAAANREGVRTDSMTLASVDTKSGDTVLLSLPRNLENFPMPEGPARNRFPYGFTGDGAGTPGLLNEVYQYAEEHPDMVPGAVKNQRGPELLRKTISGILGMPVDYYILVDMFGFADIIDAMGGVKVKIPEPIPYGQQGAILAAGERTLGGKEALWYGRSRTNSDDYTRMGRQKCLMRAIAKQADPQTILTKFDRLAAATKRALSTDIPQELLPALISLSKRVKGGAKINSLQFVPPLVSTGNPDLAMIRRLAAKAVQGSPGDATTSPSTTSRPTTSSPSPSTSTGPSTGPGGTSPSPSASPTSQTKPVSLDATCP